MRALKSRSAGALGHSHFGIRRFLCSPAPEATVKVEVSVTLESRIKAKNSVRTRTHPCFPSLPLALSCPLTRPPQEHASICSKWPIAAATNADAKKSCSSPSSSE